MSICATCQAIDLFKISQLYHYSKSPQGRKQLPVGWSHQTTYSALRSSAKNCASCALFFRASNADTKYPNKPPIQDEDCVKLFALTADQWPKRYLLGSRPEGAASLMGLKVQVGSVQSISYWKSLDLWAPYGESRALQILRRLMLMMVKEVHSL